MNTLKLPARLLLPAVTLMLLGLLTVVPAHARMLLLGNTGEPQTLDPHRYNLRLEETLLNDLFMGLTTFNAAGEIAPGAALSWSTSEDGLRWRFELRPDMRWSDGTPLTADDFVYSFQRLQDPTTAASLAYFMYMLKNASAINRGELPTSALGVRAEGPLTLLLELEQPYPYLLERLLYPTAFPVPQHIISKHGDDWVKPQHWVSNGAYTLHAWQPQAHIELHANPHFHQPAAIAKARYLPVVSEQSGYNRFRTGELHAIATFPVDELAKMKSTHPEALRMSGLLSMMYLVFNTERPPFDDPRVRQALSLAIDQQVLTDKVLRSGNQPAYSFTPALLENYQGVPLPHAREPLSARQTRARQLLADAGYDAANPLNITLRHVAGIEGKKVNLAITGMWRQIGVQARLHQSELRAHFASLREGDFEAAWAGWIGENNAEHYLSLLQSDIGNVNYGRFALQGFDQLMHQAQQTAERNTRNALLRQAEALAVDHYPVVPLYTVTVRRLVDPAIQGWQENTRDMHQLRYLNWRSSP